MIRPLPPAPLLSCGLEELEKLLVKPNDKNIERTLPLLDKACLQMAALRAQGVDLKAEAGLWSGFQIRLRTGAGEFVRAARAHGGFVSLRQHHAQTDGLWWHLDDVYQAQKRRSLFRALRWLSAIGGLVLAVWIVVTYVFPPNETAVLLSEITTDLEQTVSTQDFTAARTIVEDGLIRTHQALELLLWATVIAELAGDWEAAEMYRSAVFENDDVSPASLWVALGQNRMQVGNLDDAECAALAALELEETNAQAHFLIAGLAELRGQIDRANEYFNKTYDLAVLSQPALAVIARVRMGYMMQSPGSLTPAEATEQAHELICN